MVVKVFISWSGDQAKEVALTTRDWLRRVIQQLEPFVSTVDIAKGERWNSTVARALEETSEGIIVVTRANQHEPWLNFEAGALAKAATSASVRPILLDLSSTDVNGPLSDFQHTDLNRKEDVFELVQSINEKCSNPLDPDSLAHSFDREWDDYSTKINAARDATPKLGPQKAVRGVDELVAEILDRVRGLERDPDDVAARRYMMQLVDEQRAMTRELSAQIEDLRAANMYLSRRATPRSAAEEPVSDSRRRLDSDLYSSPSKKAFLRPSEISSLYEKIAKRGPGTRVRHFENGDGRVVGLSKDGRSVTVDFGDVAAEVPVAELRIIGETKSTPE